MEWYLYSFSFPASQPESRPCRPYNLCRLPTTAPVETQTARETVRCCDVAHTRPTRPEIVGRIMMAIRRHLRKNYAASTVSIIRKTTEVETEKNVSEIPDSDATGVDVKSTDIEAVIWSHNHFDHVGDPSTFPPSTDLIVGPGSKKQYWRGYPTDPERGLLDSDAQGRKFREIGIPKGDDCLKIGRFDAMDFFFGDGSFYLLDAPGHTVGHTCGFARVTSSPDSFVLMGAEACHHAGLFRPTEYVPLPSTIYRIPPTPPFKRL